MKERPILFKGEMVRALLDGRKTQTRRILKPQPPSDAVMRMCCATDPVRGWQIPGPSEWWENEVDNVRFKCPYGKMGDRIWVKETFARIHPGLLQKLDPDPDSSQWGTLYRADGVSDEYLKNYGVHWKPSIFMPRWASRITLEISAIRVERLQAITEEDAKAEGAECLRWFQPEGEPEGNARNLGATGEAWNWSWDQPCYRNGYARLWESINGKGSWDANPWVWVIEWPKYETEEGK